MDGKGSADEEREETPADQTAAGDRDNWQNDHDDGTKGRSHDGGIRAENEPKGTVRERVSDGGEQPPSGASTSVRQPDARDHTALLDQELPQTRKCLLHG